MGKHGFTMNSDLRNALAKAIKSYNKKDNVGLVSWLTRATGTFPQANESDSAYEGIFQRLSNFVTGGGNK